MKDAGTNCFGSESSTLPHILLVDDDEDLRNLLYSYLQDLGYPVATACNARDALTLLHRSRTSVRLLITDIDMPGMSGTELAVRAMHLCGCRVVLISGLSRPPEEDLHLWDFLAKPFSPSAFLEAVRTALNGQTREFEVVFEEPVIPD